MSPTTLTSPILAVAAALDAAWPAWLVALAAAAVVLLAWWTRQGRAGRSTARTNLLTILRIAAALALLVVLARPTLILSRDLRPKPLLTIAIDTSASMARADVVLAGAAASQPSTRLAAVTARLADREGTLLRQLLARYQVQLASVHERIVSRMTLDRPSQVDDALAWLAALKPEGPRTDLAACVQEAVATAPADRNLAGLVLLTDGRQSAGSPLTSSAESLAAGRCPAIAACAGSDTLLPDLALADVQAPPRVFVGEPVAIRGRLDVSGLREPTAASLQLVDEQTNEVLAERSVPAAAAGRPTEFTLVYEPKRSGPARLAVRAGSSIDEANLRNNQSNLQLEAVEAKLRVLYVEREARFEYRYLKNLLVREPAIASSILLLSADPEFPQEGTEPIRRFPASRDELDRYDVILLGDVDPRAGWLDGESLENLANWVEAKGGGLGLLAGPRFGLAAWRDTPLGKVLPVRPAESAAARSIPSGEPYKPTLTAEGARSPIFLLDPKDAAAEQAIGQLPAWYWAAPAGLPTPAAITLAVHPRLAGPEGPLPLVVTGHYGAGRTFYCGSDDIWRWRRFRDIDHWRSFWLQAVRWLAGPRKLGAYRKVVLQATPETVQVGQPVSLELRVNDETMVDGLPEQIGAVVREEGGDVQYFWLRRAAGLATWSGSIAPHRAGGSAVEVRLPASTQPAATNFRAVLPEAEGADTPADAAALRQWVRAVEQAGTQGYLLDLANLGELALLPLPGPQVRRQTMDLRLWDNGLALLLVAGLFLTEWAWRRARGMP